MKNKKVKIILILFGVGLLVATSIFLYMFNQPKRDVQATKTDYSYEASQIVNEYLADAKKANDKYLDEEGESKIVEITGEVSSISEDFNKQKVVFLKSPSDKAGVSCTFTQETNSDVKSIKIGNKITVKGVIRSGANYDSDLEIYENVLINNCKIVK